MVEDSLHHLLVPHGVSLLLQWKRPSQLCWGKRSGQRAIADARKADGFGLIIIRFFFFLKVCFYYSKRLVCSLGHSSGHQKLITQAPLPINLWFRGNPWCPNNTMKLKHPKTWKVAWSVAAQKGGRSTTEIHSFIYLYVFWSSFLQRRERATNLATARMTRPKWSSHTSTWKTGGMWLVMLATVSRNMGWSKSTTMWHRCDDGPNGSRG